MPMRPPRPRRQITWAGRSRSRCRSWRAESQAMPRSRCGLPASRRCSFFLRPDIGLDLGYGFLGRFELHDLIARFRDFACDDLVIDLLPVPGFDGDDALLQIDEY